MSDLTGKVAYITGVARGQGRSHAVALAKRGVRIVGIDICAPVGTAPYDMADENDLVETEKLIAEVGGESMLSVGDVRSLDTQIAAVTAAYERWGRMDIVLGNAGVCTYGELSTMSVEKWQEMMDIDLTGVWMSARAAAGPMIEAGNGGSIIFTSSTAGLRNLNSIGHYVAAKHGVTGLAKAFANELAPHNIRVNSLHPSNCRTEMMLNTGVAKMFRPDLDSPTWEDAVDSYGTIHLLNTPWVEPEDVSNAIVFLVSEEARFITGAAIPVDAGMLAK